jgi:hypothetical protein
VQLQQSAELRSLDTACYFCKYLLTLVPIGACEPGDPIDIDHRVPESCQPFLTASQRASVISSSLEIGKRAAISFVTL